MTWSDGVVENIDTFVKNAFSGLGRPRAAGHRCANIPLPRAVGSVVEHFVHTNDCFSIMSVAFSPNLNLNRGSDGRLSEGKFANYVKTTSNST